MMIAEIGSILTSSSQLSGVGVLLQIEATMFSKIDPRTLTDSSESIHDTLIPHEARIIYWCYLTAPRR